MSPTVEGAVRGVGRNGSRSERGGAEIGRAGAEIGRSGVAIGRGGAGAGRSGWGTGGGAGTGHGAPGLELTGPRVERAEEVLTPRALELLIRLHRRFDRRRLELLAAREQRQRELDSGAMPRLLPETAQIRAADWRIAPVPADLQNRGPDVIGPPDPKTIANALNAPIGTFLADFEDSCSPTWDNLIAGQVNLSDAIRRTIRRAEPGTGRLYRLVDRTATLLVRPRGWHLPEKHAWIDGEPVSGALLDFTLYVANNFEALARRRTGPYLCLPKLESHLEARLWNDVFLEAQDALGLPRGTIRAVVLIETIPAAFEVDEILYELREHAAGLDGGTRNYLFSLIKRFRNRPEFLLPDRATLTPDCRVLAAHLDLLRRAGERRAASLGARHAASLGARQADDGIAPADLLRVPAGEITEAGLRSCIRVGVQYVESWLRGIGRVPLYHAVEDASAAELCRAQLWQCLRHEARTSDGHVVTVGRFERLVVEELDRIHDEVGPQRLTTGVFPTATRLFEQVVEREPFEEFLTLPAYDLLS